MFNFVENHFSEQEPLLLACLSELNSSPSNFEVILLLQDRQAVRAFTMLDFTHRNTAIGNAYINSRRTLQSIGDEYGLTRERVRQLLKLQGILRRDPPLRPPTPTPEQRRAAKALRRKAQFWLLVDVTADPSECWVWLGGTTSGYGRYSIPGVGQYAHGVAYALHHGARARNWVLHHCDNRPCCNPTHLYDGTPQDNARDRENRGRGARTRNREACRLFTDEQAADLRAAKAEGVSVRALATQHGVHDATIYRTLKRSEGLSGAVN